MASLLILSQDQWSNKENMKALTVQLKLLNKRKDEIYNKDDAAQFQQMSPIHEKIHKSMHPSARFSDSSPLRKSDPF